MADIKSTSSVQIDITLKLTEVEARALEAIVGYGADAFLSTFYEHMGKHYLQPHEKGVRTLFSTIKSELPKHLKKASDARFVFKK